MNSFLSAQRINATLTKIGPAVLNGGFSTFLTFILLSTSQSYIFLSFFKIFTLICIFGLYHGLVVLPVMLVVAGPVNKVRKLQVILGIIIITLYRYDLVMRMNYLG